MKFLKKIYKSLGSLKAAVLLLLLLALILAFGTYYESYFGRAYAYNLVYGTTWFHLLLLFLAVNILVAALLRLPPKKYLSGFYISHLGLLLILTGSLLTLVLGIDGTLTLTPGQFNQVVRLEKPVLYTRSPNQPWKQIPLPKTVFRKEMNQKVFLTENKTFFTLKRYLPYAKESFVFQPLPNGNASGLEISLMAPTIFQKIVLSSPPSQYPEQLSLGPLSLFHLGEIPQQCPLSDINSHNNQFKKHWIFFGEKNCQNFRNPSFKGMTLSPGLKLTQVNLLKNQYSFRLDSSIGSNLFIPQISSWPLRQNQDLDMPQAISPDFSSVNRIYPEGFLFSGNSLLFFIQNRSLFVAIYSPPNPLKIKKIALNPESYLSLPWMNLKLKVNQFHPDALPYRSFKSKRPDPGEENPKSALALKVGSGIYWLESNQNPQRIPVGNSQMMEAFLGFRTFDLPWSFRLERFKMDRNPGTSNPASYESFVNLQDSRFQSLENAHIYMNHPLKKGKYTFYQASYFQVGPNQFGSVLQVNYDPGRWIKYIGSLILVLGTAIHFYIRNKKSFLK